jgi:hypothetical protein
MSPDSTTDALKQAWRQQPTSGPTITLADLKKGAGRFQLGVGIRNLIEYVAAVIVVISYSQMLLKFDAPLVKIGCVLIVIATLYVVVQIHVRLSSQKAPADAIGASFLDFHRAAVLRQIAGHRGIARWYMAPFLPGFSLFILQSLLDQKWGQALGLSSMLSLVVFGGIWLNHWAARRLTRKLAELDALIPGSELDRRSVY